MISPILAAAITRSSPSFHNPGHMRMWYDSPLRNFDAHLVTAIFVIIILSGIGWFIYFQLKHRELEKKIETGTDEKYFHDLVVKQKVILNKILELEEMHKKGELADEEFKTKLNAYRQHLIKVKVELQQLTD
ncbi:hypothetical protein RJD24_01240 [Bacillaceae bacterium IKA-2]|nr:hypothetical protein RJD24_01240 [Bacillaceae bacterium IKA-2]